MSTYIIMLMTPFSCNKKKKRIEMKRNRKIHIVRETLFFLRFQLLIYRNADDK